MSDACPQPRAQAGSTELSGQASDIEIQAREIIRQNDLLRGIIAKHTGQDEERIKRDFDRDFFMDPLQAKDYGIVDEILALREAGVRPVAGMRS